MCPASLRFYTLDRRIDQISRCDRQLSWCPRQVMTTELSSKHYTAQNTLLQEIAPCDMAGVVYSKLIKRQKQHLKYTLAEAVYYGKQTSTWWCVTVSTVPPRTYFCILFCPREPADCLGLNVHIFVLPLFCVIARKIISSP